MAGRIALVGGDEFRAGCEAMDRVILGATGVDEPTVSIVPTAAAHQNPSMAASNGVTHFTGLGARASALMVLERSQANDEGLLSPVDSAHVIYLTGGDPSHLLEVLRDSLLLEKLRAALARGATVAGSSAGAMVLGSWMRFRTWTECLGIVKGVAVLPHHERSEPAKVAKEMEGATPSGVVVLGIDSETGCLTCADGWQALGSGAVTLYSEGRWARYSDGDAVPLETHIHDDV